MRRATHRNNYRNSCKYPFQSTLSVRRATLKHLWVNLIFQFQSTLSVRRATVTNCLILLNQRFQSTLSVRRATVSKHLCTVNSWISIHALREESDACGCETAYRRTDFNPRSPWGERHKISDVLCISPIDFNPRSPWGERPYSLLCKLCILKISIQSLSVRRATGFGEVWYGLATNFNPRSPWGERQ